MSAAETDATWDAVLAILADGARPDVMASLAAAGEMPNFKRHFVDRGGFRTATGVFPTVSGPAHLPLLTGIHPGEANLPGIRWAERPTGASGGFLFRTRSYMALGRARKIERDIPAWVTTLFQHLPGVADVNTWFVRGCPRAARMTRFSKGAAFMRSLLTTDWYASDLQAERGVLRAWNRGYRSAFAVFPAIDELGHRFGPDCDESHEAYRRFDQALGRLIDELSRRRRLDRTLIVLTSDHGQTATHTHLDVDDLVREVYPKTLAYPKLWRHIFSAEAAAMVSGNAMANVYLQGPKGWSETPDFDDAGSRAAELLHRLVGHPGIEHVIYRRGSHTFVVAGREGRLTVSQDRTDHRTDHQMDHPTDPTDPAAEQAPPDPILRLSVEGKDPLGYEGVPRAMHKSGAAGLTSATRFPDLPAQLVDFFRARRAGDLIVCARVGYDLRSRYEYQPHRGSHGCLDREHMLVPAAVNASFTEQNVRAVDLFPTMLAAVGAPPAPRRTGRAIPLLRVP